MNRTFALMIFAAGALALSGCQCCSRRPAAVRTTVVPGTPIGPGGIYVPPPPAPIGGAPIGGAPLGAPPVGGAPSVRVVQPPNFPPPAITPPPPGAAPPPPPAVAPLPSGTSSQSSPRLEPNWQPAEGRPDGSRIAQAVPDPLLGTPGAGSNPNAKTPATPKLYPPDVSEKSTIEPPLLDEKRQAAKPPNGKTPSVDEKRTTAGFPTGIAQFVPTIPRVSGVANGLRPSIDDGLDWLAKNHYKTVLHLRAPGEAEGPDRTQVEKLGMTYISLEIGPKGLTRERVDEFAKLVGETDRQPLFVYDQDGSLAGPLWYLYFRKVSGDNDESARIRAGSLGLRPDRDGQHRQMWLAVQKYLEENR